MTPIDDVEIAIEDPLTPDIIAVLQQHLDLMHEVSPPGKVFALDVEALRVPEVTFWTARTPRGLMGCGALKQLTEDHGEIKSMHTVQAARRTGIARLLVQTLVAESRARHYKRLSLETGTTEAFAPARGLYASLGFETCGCFADYAEDPHSAFMTLALG